MRLHYSRNNWTYSIDFDILIDFCLWALQVDGLHVPPFEQHGDGDGSLRALGLTPENWRTWLHEVLDQHSEYKQAMQQLPRVNPLNPSKDIATRSFPQRHDHLSFWNGNVALQTKLAELWKQYGPLSNQRKRQVPTLTRALHKEERASGKRLFDELRPYQTRIPPLTIYLLSYEQPIDYLIPPSTLLMTLQAGQPTPEEFRMRVLAAAEELAARPGQRKKTAHFTRIENTVGQPISAYRMHIRNPLPPTPPPQEIPQLADPFKQMVVNKVAGEHPLYGPVDMSTFQFLREKHIPDWKLYDVHFQEMDGEEHHATFILQRYPDGIWRQGSSTSSGSIQQRAKYFAQIRDHPVLLFSTSLGGDSLQHYRFHAYGDIIDNGFHVERVRLVADTGLVLEDTVEQGLVFFACTQRITLPMQAELYDNEGRLVWKQTVPDHKLPPWFKAEQR